MTPGVPADAAPAASFAPSGTHWRYLEAYVDLLEDGHAVNLTSWGAKLGVSKQAVWKMQLVPGFMPWINQRLELRNEQHVGAVVGKMGSIALRSGSPKHAELYLKAQRRLTDKVEHQVKHSWHAHLAELDDEGPDGRG